ncbi:MAG TPA: transcription elongation factor Spt5 [Euryarchaeota archaeon]|nr:transcription elongation factor Spt5 [Euryarchaeota archaeon]
MGKHRDNPGIQDNINFTTTSRQAFMAVKTQIGQEKAVAEALGHRAKEKNVELSSILNPHPLRGYVIIESMKSDMLIDVVKSVKKAKGIVEGEMPFEEIEKYLTPKAIVSGITEGDIVELVAGPFKGEKARVQQINEDREEITVELFEAMVPIPVTVRGDHVRVIEKDKDKVKKDG